MKTSYENVIVVDHPLCEHNMTHIRDKNASADSFINSLKRVAQILMYTATKELPLECCQIQTPIAECDSMKIDESYKIVFAPILRAGLALSEVAKEIYPEASIQHVGMYRDEATLEPVWYYDKTPVSYSNPEKIKVFVLDPMLATGNSSKAAVSLFLKKGISIENIVFVSVLAAPEGLDALTKEFPGLKIYTAHIDKTLNSKAYIVPGLGDAGDRLFNTFEK